MTQRDTTTDLSRRDFLLTTSAGALAVSTSKTAHADDKTPLPKKTLGQTGVKVPILGLGTAPAGFRTDKEAIALYYQCIDSGITYLDTAPESGGYGKAQKYLGEVLKTRRKEAFIITK